MAFSIEKVMRPRYRATVDTFDIEGNERKKKKLFGSEKRARRWIIWIHVFDSEFFYDILNSVPGKKRYLFSELTIAEKEAVLRKAHEIETKLFPDKKPLFAPDYICPACGWSGYRRVANLECSKCGKGI